jgi:hypothetical protein
VREGNRIRLALVLGLLILASTLPVDRASAGPPTLPVQTGRLFLTDLNVAATAPGTTVGLGYELSNPLAAALTNVSLEFAFYSFNPYPGTGATSLPTSSPTLTSAASAGPNLTLPVGTLAGHASDWTQSIEIVIPSGAPLGTYAVRDSITFDLNGSKYLLASIGNFPASTWQSANVLANGSPTVNLTRLGVSGILPETALLVNDPAPIDLALYAVLGAGFALAIAGAYVALRRRGPGSRSGTRSAPDESQAPTALGNKRSKDGD